MPYTSSASYSMVRYTLEQKQRIAADAHKDGVNATSRKWGCDRKTTRRYLRLLLAGESLQPLPVRRRRWNTPRERFLAKRFLLSDRKHTFAQAIAFMWHCHKVKMGRKTLRSILFECGRARRRARTKPGLLPRHRAARLAYAREYREIDPRRILCHDEASFSTIRPPNLWVTRAPHETYLPGCLTPKYPKESRSVHVWAGYSWYGKTELVIFDTSVSLTKRKGVTAAIFRDQVMNGPLLRAWGVLKREQDMPVILADKNGIHDKDGNRDHAVSLGMDFLPHTACSPDLNTQEDVWGHMRRRLASLPERPRGREAYIAALRKIWDEIEMPFLRTLLESMPRRFEAVIEARGGHTKY